ncbi:MAG: ATP-binding cassette domain-containing protein, partial [Acidobacteria bacterium]
APRTGPERAALDRRLREAVASVRRPPGYAIEPPAPERSRRWFREVILPVVLLLYGVLAVTFESLVLPLLVLTALPLTVVGAVVALLVAGLPADTMALVGALALLGLTVNPAILLIDRMQRRALGGRWGAGAAALAAVRERTRPVLMTSATTIAGLWPLALATGRENEIWPPFATVVMGGLATSTLLTLLVIPVGFVLLRRLDELFGRLGPWIVIAWAVATAVVVVPLAWSGLVASLTWRAITTALVAAGWLGLAVLLAPKPPPPEPRLERNGPPRLEVRFLHKTYGGPGPVARAWAAPEEFARRVLARGGRPFHPGDARAALVGLALAAAGALYLAFSLGTGFWRLVAGFAAAGLAARGLMEFRRARGRADDLGRPLPGGPEAVLAACAPWIVFEVAVERWWVVPALDGTASPGSGEFVRRAVLLSVVGAVVLVVQLGRRTAVRLARQEIDADPRSGRALRLRRAWRSLARRLFGLGLTYRPVVALRDVGFEATGGMIGVLGPNGAGKTTLLRQIAGMLEPSRGVVRLGGVDVGRIRRQLARYVGYLPQDFGLPLDMTAREYLDLFARLYGVGDPEARRKRVERLLREVGLEDRADERLGRYSGGMRQRAAVARTLLRLPPVIVVDEPTVGLDPRERIRFRNLLARLAEGRIVLFSTHVVEDVAVACERVLVLAAGRLVFDGAPEELSRVATGRVYEVDLPPERAGEELPGRVVDRLPLPGGGTRVRLLAAGPPPGLPARPVPATLQDGYLLLVTRAAEGEAA